MSDRQCYHCKGYWHISSFCRMKSHDNQGSISSSGSSQTGSGVPRKTEKSKSGQSKPQYNGVNPRNFLRCETTVDSGADNEMLDPAEIQLKKCVLLGTLEGKQVRILRDSACTQTAVKASLVPSQCYLPSRHITVRGIGGPVTVPLALVNLQCAVVSGQVLVAAIDGLQRDVLLGHDLHKTCGEILAKEMCMLTQAQANTE